ncbi:MAG: hypothetical protein ACLFM0_10050 [Spirochaetales bacterium]
MNEAIETIITYALTENVMLVSFLGVSLLLSGTEGVRTAIKNGVLFAATVILAAVVGPVLANTFPGDEVTALLVFLVVSLASIAILRAGGQLAGDRMGLPAPLFALPLFFGTQYTLYELGMEFSTMVAAAAGSGIGVYLAYVLAYSMYEQIRLTETTSPVKGLPALVFALGLLGFAMTGFQLL